MSVSIRPVAVEDGWAVYLELAPLLDRDKTQWQDRALCSQVDPEIFFPEKGGSTAEAKRVCRACDVRAECLDYALELDERFGIYGGYSERERRRLKQRQIASGTRSAGPRMCGKKLHEMTPANIYTYPNGRETCKACKDAHNTERSRRAGYAENGIAA